MRLGLVALALLAACKDAPPECIVVETECAALYEPTFHNVYENTLKTGCGSTKTSCHSDIGRKGGMTFSTEQGAYDALLDGRVTASDPGCSELVVRTSSPGEDYQMPIGSPLKEAERCAIIKWVSTGALR